MLKAKSDSETVLVASAAFRDSTQACDILTRGGVHTLVQDDVVALCRSLEDGAGAALLAEEVLTWPTLEQLQAVVAKQEPWSDFPFVVFRANAGKKSQDSMLGELSALGNVTVLDRPVRTVTLVSTVKSLVRGRRRQYEARRAISSRDQFLAVLGHEMRNPLGAISLAAQVLKRVGGGGLGERVERQRAVIERQTRHLSRLVDDLLDVVRVVSGKVELDREPVELNQLVRHCIKLTEVAMSSKGMSWFFSPAMQPMVIDADSVRLDQVFTNLLTNAVKYSPPGATVDVSLERDGNHALVRVRDSGAGIPNHMLESIFDLFTQVETTLPSSQGGLGVGLTLVRQIVEQHGGRVQAMSDGPGSGSEFQVRLPLSRLGRSEEQTAVNAIAVTERSMRVLLIEDCEDTRESLRELLCDAGHVVTAVADGATGLEAAGRADVVVIDIGLPGMDGLEVARRIRAAGHPATLVAVTGYAHQEYRDRALAAGFDLHLPKPMDIDALHDVLRGSAGRAGNGSAGTAAAARER